MTTRGLRSMIPLAVALVLLGACAGLRAVSSGPAPRVDLATAIAVSVSSDSIFLVDPATGTRQTIVTGLTGFQAGYAAWAPGHRTLAYGDGGLVVLDPAASASRVLAQGALLSMPSWSPTGTRIAYGNGTAMWVTPAATLQPSPVPLPSTLAPLDVAWGPDGLGAMAGLGLDCAASGGCVSTAQSDLWVVRLDGRGEPERRQITHLGNASKPKWSADGSLILFVHRPSGLSGPAGEPWTVAPDGTAASRLIDAEDVVAADWSPDGTRLVVVRRPSPGMLRLWVGAADGSDLRPLGAPFPGPDATVDW